MRVHILDNGGDGLDKILLWLSENEEILEVNVQKEIGAFLDKVEREKPELVFIRLGDAEIPGLEVGRLVKGMDFEGLDRVIDTHIKNIRQKIEPEPKQPIYILTVRGSGYRFGGKR